VAKSGDHVLRYLASSLSNVIRQAGRQAGGGRSGRQAGRLKFQLGDFLKKSVFGI